MDAILWTMGKVQKNLSIAEDVFVRFEEARDVFGHGNGWAIITSALRRFLEMSPADQISAIRAEHDRDIERKLTAKAARSAQSPVPAADASRLSAEDAAALAELRKQTGSPRRTRKDRKLG